MEQQDGSGNCVTIQKSITLYFINGIANSGNTPTYSAFPSLPNVKSSYRLFGNVLNFKYHYETKSNQNVTRIETDDCKLHLYLIKSEVNNDIELQLFCDSGPKASFGGWSLSKMKWANIKIALVNPETKKISSAKKVEGETRCGKLLCVCGQSKLCLRKQGFSSAEYLQPFYVINKCVKPKDGMVASFYNTIDAQVTVTLFPHNPKTAPVAFTNLHELFWKTMHDASKRIFHARIGNDFKLEADGKEFPCHKCILAGHSEVFNRMFTAESNTRSTIIYPSKLVMENMSAVGVDAFLKYLYFGDTTFSELPANVSYELMKAAEKYHIPHLRTTSYEILFQKPLDDFDCETALKLYLGSGSPPSTTYISQYSSLRKVAIQYFTKYYVDLVKSKEFVKLFGENRECAQEILIKIHKNKWD